MATITAELGTFKGEILAVIKTRQFDRFSALAFNEPSVLKDIGSMLGIERKEYQTCNEFAAELYNKGLENNSINFYDEDLFN